MSDSTYKLIEIAGTSSESLDAAIQNGIKKAGESLRNIGWFQVGEIRGRVDADKVAEYQVIMKVGLKLD
ncbi:MAG: flavin-binding protein dodecin [Planctomycetota bacterium]|jgi:flavin-binding protein dodecin